MLGLGLGAMAGTVIGGQAAFAGAGETLATAPHDAIGDLLAAQAQTQAQAGAASRLGAGWRTGVAAEIRKVAVHNLHTDETFSAVYWERGQYLTDALAQVDRVLRDYRTGDVHPIDRNLLDLLDDLSVKTETSAPFQVISAYRSPLTNSRMRETSSGVARHSLHMEGRALDIRSERLSLPSLRKAAIGLGRGGVGYYPRSEFVHVDVGAVRTWQGA